jgi:hypothetical protein
MFDEICNRPATYVTTNADAKKYLGIQRDEAQIHWQIRDEILESLRYDAINLRYEAVPEAHEQTFAWILQPNHGETESEWSDFAQWLQEGEGIFWINGKAGSGKSTLMKYSTCFQSFWPSLNFDCLDD